MCPVQITHRIAHITHGFDSPIWFIIRTLCLYTFRLCTLNMRTISTYTRIRMMTAGAVVATGNDHCPLKIAAVLNKMCQLRRVLIELISATNGQPTLNKPSHIRLTLIDQPHTKNILRMHS